VLERQGCTDGVHCFLLLMMPLVSLLLLLLQAVHP
jgi:hypothetical protein